MKKIILMLYLCTYNILVAQTPITDTINAESWEEAMDLTFGLLPKTHFATGYLINKAPTLPKMAFANGTLNDSSFNMLEFYFIQNSVKMSYYNTDSIKNYLYLDSIKNIYIENNNTLPWGVINIDADAIKDSAFVDGSIAVQSHRLVEGTSDLKKIYSKIKLFCASPLNMEVYTMNPQFILKPEYIFSNSTFSISSIDIDLDDGGGLKPIALNVPFQASYSTGGYKQFITRMIYSNGDTLFSRSELNVIDNSEFTRMASSYQTYDETYTKYITGPTGGGLGTSYTYPTEFSPGVENDRYAEVGIWYGCGNVAKKLRKPLVIFAGYNPKDGKSLQGNTNAPWINNSAGGVLALDGWRGPLYETYNGFFTDASKNADNGQSFGSNGNNFLDKVRQEGYDVVIVRFWDGVGYLQTTAFLTTIILKDINEKILTETDDVQNPGAALDPEAPGYPNSTKIKKAKHELVVSGYSAGAIASRMGLLLMEYEHEKYKCTVPVGHTTTNPRLQSPVHRTKLWIAVDNECQGSNVPIGQQMFMDFQQNLLGNVANIGDILNSIAAHTALGLLKKRGVATQNTLYHLNKTYSTGGSNWKVGHDNDFDVFFADLARITPAGHPGNLIGYPKNCYRIAVSQGSANGVQQLLDNNTNLIYNQSPSSWCVSHLGTMFGAGTVFFRVTPFRQATARVLSSWNNDAFDCKRGISIRTLFYNWHINIADLKYKPHNYIQDEYVGTYQTYDIAPASTLPSHMILARAMALAVKNPVVAAFTGCNLKDWNEKQHGFSPTVSGLDLHPGNTNFPRLPNLSLAPPGNISGGLNLMQQNKYNGVFTNSPHNDFGFVHLTYPNNQYDVTPYDAVWANTRDDANYDDNTIHVEDPNPYIGEFLEEEVAPKTLYLSNRTIEGEIANCGQVTYHTKYYADFEARNSVLAGDQTIYQHNGPPYYDRVRTSPGDFVVGSGAVVTIRANNGDGASSVVLGAGFSAKAGSILRAYVFTDPNACSPFSYRQRQEPTAPQNTTPQPRPIVSKRVSSQKLSNATKSINIALYPNPSTGSVYYEITDEAEYNYSIMDITGKVLQTGIIKNGQNSLNLSIFDKGIYLITVSNNTYTQTDRIILQ